MLLAVDAALDLIVISIFHEARIQKFYILQNIISEEPNTRCKLQYSTNQVCVGLGPLCSAVIDPSLNRKIFNVIDCKSGHSGIFRYSLFMIPV